MPLSEDEQRILQEIEARLYEESPELVRNVSSTTIYSHAFRNIKWAMLGFVVGIGILIAGLMVHFLAGFGGFLVMLVCALSIEHNARKMGRVGWAEMSTSVRSQGMRNFLGSTSTRLKGRMGRPDES